MNQPYIIKAPGYVTLLIISAMVTLACALAAPGAKAQSSSRKTSGTRAEWPTKEPYDAAICAFDKALTKASQDKKFRERLTKSCESAKKAVAEVGDINIPDNRMIIFYEGEAAPLTKDDHDKLRKLFESRSSEKIHVFALPPWKNNDTAEYRYEEYFVGMYEYWLRKEAPCKLKSP